MEACCSSRICATAPASANTGLWNVSTSPSSNESHFLMWNVPSPATLTARGCAKSTGGENPWGEKAGGSRELRALARSAFAHPNRALISVFLYKNYIFYVCCFREKLWHFHGKFVG